MAGGRKKSYNIYAENTSKMKHHEGWCGECACCKAHAHDVVGKAQIQKIRPSTLRKEPKTAAVAAAVAIESCLDTKTNA